MTVTRLNATGAFAGSRRRAAFILLLLVVAFHLPVLRAAEANGGTIKISNVRSGPFDLSAFTDPTPVRVGVCDISVAVAGAGSGDLVQDASVTVSVSPVDHEGAAGSYPATHELATNKLFYAAHAELPAAGRWRVDIAARSGLGEGSASFEMDVEEARPFDYHAAVAAGLLVPGLLLVWLLVFRSRRPRRGEHR